MAQVIPAEYNFLNNQPQTVQVKRFSARQLSDTNSYGLGGRIQIQFPADFLDLRGSFLTMNCVATANAGTPGTYVRFSYPITTIFTRLQVYMGSQVIEDIQDADLLQGIWKNASSYQSVQTNSLEGSFAAAARATETTAGRLYTCHLHLESLMRVIPAHKLKVPLRLVATINGSAASFMEYDGGVPTINVTDVYYNFHTLQVSQAISDTLDQALATGQCKIYFRSWDNYNVALQSSTQQSVLLPFRRKNVDAIIAVWRDSLEVVSAVTDGKFVRNFEDQPILASAKVNGWQYPLDQIQANYNLGFLQTYPVLASIFQSDLKAYNRQLDMFAYTATAANGPSAIFVADMRADSGPQSDGLYGNGVDMSQSATSAQLQLAFSVSPGAQVLDAYGRYEVVVTIDARGNISVDS